MAATLIVCDARSLADIKRIAMHTPYRKCNVYNKISLSAGTSH